jgi:FolB domain-containing protein
MVDRIFIENLRIKCRIGVTEEERRDPQDVILDVNLFRSLDRAAITNSLDDTANYREVMERISDFVSEGEFTLLESLADGLAVRTLNQFGVDRVSVRVRKGKYSSEPSVGVEVVRSADAEGRPWSKR